MTFWPVLKLEISYRVMICWRTLVSFRGTFWRFYFCMVEYLSFHNSSFALRYLLFNVNGKAGVWHTPCLSISCNRSFIAYRSTTPMFLCTINPLPPSMQQLFNKIIKWGLHNPLLCKTAFSHQPKLNFLLLRFWWPRGKKVWCIRWQGKQGCNPMFITDCCWCQLLWRWIMNFLRVGLNESIEFTCFDYYIPEFICF